MGSWSSVINAVDQGSKGFIILRKDVGAFFENYNVNTFELQNRKKLRSLQKCVGVRRELIFSLIPIFAQAEQPQSRPLVT